MIKLIRWIHKLFTRKDKITEEGISEVSYYLAKYFLNDLDNEDDYYLEVRRRGDNKFVRKDEVGEQAFRDDQLQKKL